MNFYQLLTVSVFFNVTANILLKKGVLNIGGVTGQKSKLFAELIKASLNPYIIIGIFLYGLSFIIWLRVLTISDLSKSYPLFATIVFLFTTIGSMIFLKETITIYRVVGILIMLIGIFVVARY